MVGKMMLPTIRLPTRQLLLTRFILWLLGKERDATRIFGHFQQKNLEFKSPYHIIKIEKGDAAENYFNQPYILHITHCRGKKQINNI